MTIGLSSPSDVAPSAMAVLMLSVFTVSMGFGVVLPLLPYLIERMLGAGSDQGQVSRATGLLTGLYTLSLFVFAPMWGRLSDRHGRRAILLIGLIGFSTTMLTFAIIDSLTGVYIERALSGLFAAAVSPVALAAIGDLAPTEEIRGRRLTFVSLAGISGFLLGPMLGVLMSQVGSGILPMSSPTGSLAMPLAGTAVIGILVAIAAAVAIPGRTIPGSDPHQTATTLLTDAWLVVRLLGLAFIVAAGVAVFEVGLALRGKQELALTQVQIATMFTECSAVMIIVQAIVFSPWLKPETTRWFITPALGIMAAGLFAVPFATDFAMMLGVIAAVAASAGILSPIVTYWTSSKAGRAQGAELGKQTAAASLGAAVGSAAGGMLFASSWLPGAAFFFAFGLSLLGVLLSLKLPWMLVVRAQPVAPVNSSSRRTIP
ncbi:MAG: MFS transporter [Rhodospirillales bacterium]|nr:MFS transporter [Rhodospirillales bacterium]